ncbi:protoheme IX farnesyltransferase [Aerophototrophica crusticola]|uniref:Protoheme IX farnesyltransferase n=1 Tax=Aerophototrophica crusticola TaxID=1709002 RepID=A0A858R423_9PROT|nr:protoheme IX farnesyltransferase [Rhodospirillaceae bacterium B3]
MTDTALDMSVETGAASYGAASVKDYVALLKPRVMSLVVFSGLAGLIVAPGHLHPVLAAVAILCIAIGAGAAGAINMWYDRDIDAIMARTQKRPLPQGRMDPDEALAFGVFLSVASVVLMGLAVNWVAAALLGLANAFYVFVYTMWLKRRTPQNIVIGGAAGAFPPMIGWAAVTGDVSLASIILFALIFFWTPPHFWALAIFRKVDYSAAGVPMLPVVAGEAETKRQMLWYTLALFPIGVAPYFVGVGGPVYLAGSIILGGLFVLSAIRVLRSEDHKPAKQMFTYSILYLFLMFALLIGERLAA